MATLRFQIKGEPGSVGYGAFLAALEDWLSILRDLDSGISGQPRGSLDWAVTDLSKGSLVIEIESKTKLADKNFGPQVAEVVVTGLERVERLGASPPYLSERGMGKARHLVRLIGRDGTTGFAVTHLENTVDLTAQASVHLDQLMRVQQRSMGSVEGKLETISVHGRPRFVVYHGMTRKAVSCQIRSDEWLRVALNALESRKRVNVTGLVHYNLRGEPIRVEVDNIRILRDRSELPTTADIRGSDPAFTGQLSTEAFVREIRGG